MPESARQESAHERKWYSAAIDHSAWRCAAAYRHHDRNCCMRSRDGIWFGNIRITRFGFYVPANRISSSVIALVRMWGAYLTGMTIKLLVLPSPKIWSCIHRLDRMGWEYTGHRNQHRTAASQSLHHGTPYSGTRNWPETRPLRELVIIPDNWLSWQPKTIPKQNN